MFLKMEDIKYTTNVTISEFQYEISTQNNFNNIKDEYICMQSCQKYDKYKSIQIHYDAL